MIRADASGTAGSGHVMRCLTLAQALQSCGWKVFFASDPETRRVVSKLHDWPCVELNDPLSPDDIKHHFDNGIDLLITDNYAIGTEYQSACRPWAGRILAIDDLANRQHDCDILLDQTLGRSDDSYAHLVPVGTMLLLGTDYALLGADFARMRQGALLARQTRHSQQLLISAGMTDPLNITPRLIEAVSIGAPGWDIDIVIGSSCPYLNEIQVAAAKANGRIHIDSQDMSRLMAEADLAIGAAGTTAWERCCMGLPTLMLTVADNQIDNARALDEAGAATYMGDARSLSVSDIAAHVESCVSDRPKLQSMSHLAARVCNGTGALRATHAIQKLFN
ncbi:MAG: UDP-2,4-diacetamido-2,4,6-trideoxy-beta-L-altropyranose hydrolase [Ferrovibrio sp.]